MINAETGREKVKIAFQKGAYWKDIIVDKGIIASANKIVSLADYGISVTSETSRALVKFLSDLENFNIDLIETKISTSKFGWIKDEFMPYGMNIEFDSESRSLVVVTSGLIWSEDYERQEDLKLMYIWRLHLRVYCSSH